MKHFCTQTLVINFYSGVREHTYLDCKPLVRIEGEIPLSDGRPANEALFSK